MTTAVEDPPYVLPKSLSTTKGKPLPVPKRLRDKFVCTECGATLVRAQSLWVCPNQLHGKSYTDGTLIDLLEAAIRQVGYKQIKAERILHKQRRIRRHTLKAEEAAAQRERMERMIEELTRLTKKAKFLRKEIYGRDEGDDIEQPDRTEPKAGRVRDKKARGRPARSRKPVPKVEAGGGDVGEAPAPAGGAGDGDFS